MEGSPYGREDRVLALSFDDGPGPSTGAVLDALAESGTPATFFVIGSNADENPSAVVRMAAEGHAVGTHTWGHVRPDGLEDAEILADTLRANARVEELIGRPVRLVRPPYLTSYAPRFDAVLAPMSPATVIWSIDPRDWGKDDESGIATAVLANLHPGGIVVMHDGGRERPATVAAIPAIVAGARAAGYRFVTL
jgi:peptidoglycan/xylan/chitin deacetylase (PgdA/CDA1 family)